MVSIVNRVGTSLISAQANAKMGDLAIGIYETAKTRNDYGMMERAMSYASPAIKDALKHSSDVSDDLEKAIDDIHKEEKVEKTESEKQTEEKKKADELAAKKAAEKIDTYTPSKTPSSTVVQGTETPDAVLNTAKTEAAAVQLTVEPVLTPSAVTPSNTSRVEFTPTKTVGAIVDLVA